MRSIQPCPRSRSALTTRARAEAAGIRLELAAILFPDVVGYSRLMADDEAETVKTLKAHKDLMGGLIRQHAGRVVDAVGDDLLADFPSVVDAVACAVAIQNELAALSDRHQPG